MAERPGVSGDGERPPSLRGSPHLVPTRDWGVVVDAASTLFYSKTW